MEKTKVHISFSEYRLWNSCSFKWFLTKRLKYTEPSNEFLIFGSALHAAIEEIIKKKTNPVFYEGTFKKCLAEETNGVHATSFFGKKMVDHGTKILKELDFKVRFKDWEVVGVELDLYEPLYETDTHEVNFKGFIDLILKQGDQYLILDWKSAMKPWDLDKKKEDKGFWRQLALYKHFYSKKFNIPLEQISTRYVALARSPVDVQQVELEVSPAFMEETLTDVLKAIKEILEVDPTLLNKAKHNETEKSFCQYCIFHKEKVCDSTKNQIPPIKEVVS